LSRAAILSNEKYRGIRVSLSAGLIELQAHNPEQEEAEEKLEVEYQGEDLVIGFNVGYLLDVLNVLEEEIVVVDLKDSNSSALICGQGNLESRYVVMPMRL
jgi:DNA polymerase-3 subunit beta